MTDKRFSAIKPMVEADKINNFQDILDIVPKTVLSEAINMNTRTLGRKAAGRAGSFTFEEAEKIARVFDVEYWTMARIIFKPKKSARPSTEKSE